MLSKQTHHALNQIMLSPIHDKHCVFFSQTNAQQLQPSRETPDLPELKIESHKNSNGLEFIVLIALIGVLATATILYRILYRKSQEISSKPPNFESEKDNFFG